MPVDRNRGDRLTRKLSGFHPDGELPAVVPLDYPHADLQLYVTSKVERQSRVFSCRKEPWTVEWLDRHVRPGDVVFDVGANVGAYALIAAHRTGEHGRVVAFEPGYASYAHLCDNIVLNGFARTIVPIPLPIADRTALGTFSYHRLYPGHARHGIEAARPQADAAAPIYEQTALLMSLDDLAQRFALPWPRLLKIDVDGAELMVLRGARTLLARTELEHVLLEIELHNSDAVVELLAAAGLTLQQRHQRTYDDGRLADYWYGIFARATAPTASST